jgi:hypothetical protein
MAKPSEFYIGVIDLFAILLPGSVAAALLEAEFGDTFLSQLGISLDNTAAMWIAFLASSYFLGHLIFLLGSYIDPFYDLIRKKTIPVSNEKAFLCATDIRDSMVDKKERAALNTFQWSRSVLLTHYPSAAQDIHRLEADSKFFRSLLVVLLFLAIVLSFNGAIWPAVGTFILMTLCFIRYFERRLKSTTQAYIHIITLHRLGKLKLAI